MRMVICPVCEHAQERGGECLVCGKRLREGAASAGPAPPLEGLEPTRFAPSAAPDAGRLADLDPNAVEASVRAAPEEPAPWIERTACEPVLAMEVEPLEVERTASAPDGAPGRDLLALPSCRYCRAPASPGEAFCTRCGLKLPLYAEGAPATTGRRESRRCRFCGEAGAGDACPSCGARFPPES